MKHSTAKSSPPSLQGKLTDFWGPSKGVLTKASADTETSLAASQMMTVHSKKGEVQKKITEFFKVARSVHSSTCMSKQVPYANKRFGSCQISYYFRVMSKTNEWRGVEYPIFEIVLKYLTVKECQTKFARVCKQWKHLDFRMFCSYSSFKSIENGRFTAKELKLVLKKGSKILPHIRVYREIIRRDFRNQYEFFNQNIALQTRVADILLVQLKASTTQNMRQPALLSMSGTTQHLIKTTTKGKAGESHRLYQTFKIKSHGLNSTHNFLSDKSFQKICQKSRDSLEDLAIRNSTNLSIQCISDNLGGLKRLTRLDLSYSKQIDDSVITTVACEIRNLKKLCLRFLNLVTHQSISKVVDNLKLLEGLDLSGCFGINLELPMIKMRDNPKLTCLLLEYLLVMPSHMYHLRYTKVHTLSLFYSKTVSPHHCEVLQQLPSLTNLNLKDCPLITEESVFTMIEDKKGSPFQVVNLSSGHLTPRVQESLSKKHS